MNRPSFLTSVIVAFGIALVASVALSALTPFAGIYTILKLLVATAGGAYILFLLSQAAEKTGRLTCVALWLLIVVVGWIVPFPLTLYLVTHLIVIWLIRSLYFYSSAIPVFVDLCLTVFATAVGYWVFTHTGSIFLSVWSHFLTQALFVFIAPDMNRNVNSHRADVRASESFDNARRTADAAIRHLFSQQQKERS